MTRTGSDSWSCNNTTVSYTDWADTEPDNDYMGRSPASFVYLSAADEGKWADGGHELDYSGIRFMFMCSYPCEVGQEEGCIPNKYPGQQTTVVVHSSTNANIGEMEKEGTMEGMKKEGSMSGEKDSLKSEMPYTPSLDLSQVMEVMKTSYDGYYGKRFVVGGAEKDFFEASNICREMGGSLPCLQNILQQEVVAQLNNGSLWLGGIDYYEEGVWECESGDSLLWTNWADEQPDDKVGVVQL